ncbi:TetR family transcriptional regulator [Actinoplanes oblitus]|uniref:TetR family transcriptional regulator n=1 Tax=Actinoplanes oblitus TaxID=3040509 RepID=A0ABY8W6K2_9ACTN|nr:TetR family transcriptional regulator [Actinoplanes oblitus]WIM92972.1 TetR family transcriptional regulator [Actinoplanes oblitus]
MAKDTRTRMIDAAVAALRQRGLAGMSFSDVLADSGAARGAIYHHFPGGKRQLAAEAASRNGQDVHAHLAGLPRTSPLAVVEAFLAGIRPVVEESTRGSGCAVAAVTLELDGNSAELRGVAAAAFASWAGQLAESLAAAGMARDDAADLASLLISLLEGAHVLCRAAGSLEPFDQAARAAVALVGATSARQH